MGKFAFSIGPSFARSGLPFRLIAGALFALTLAIVGNALFAGPNWGTVAGQTVPRTPPPTFTPTATITPNVPPTPTPSPTATFTPAPGQPTPVPRPDLVSELSVAPEIVGPGDPVKFLCRVTNRGNASAGAVEVLLPVSRPLAVRSLNVTRGSVSLEEGGVLLRLEALPPGEEALLTVLAEVRQDASPGRTLLYRARLTYDGEVRESNAVQIILPRAILPATGG